MAEILLVGRRNAAKRAAKRLGYEPVSLVAPPRDEQAAGAFGGAADSAVELARAELGDRVPAAVVAVAEGAVPAAAAIRAAFGLPGLSPEIAARCHDKLTMKRAVAAAGVPCAPWCEVYDATTPDELIDRLGLPVVLKLPVSSGGRGVWIAETAEAVAVAMRPGMLAEGFVDGVEMSVETLLAGGDVLFRNPTRYLRPRWANLVPADLGAAERDAVDALAGAAHRALGVDTGITHAELFLTRDGAVFGEIAARPPGGHLMELIDLAYGFDPWEALLRIALGQRPELPAAAARCAAMTVLHPGPGVVAAVDGVDTARAVAGVHRVRVRVEPGDTVAPRVGSGQSVGEIVTVAETAGACADALAAAEAALRIELAC